MNIRRAVSGFKKENAKSHVLNDMLQDTSGVGSGGARGAGEAEGKGR